MDVEALRRALTAAGVPPDAVGEPGGEPAWCVRPVAVGEGTGWEIFWSERGERWEWTRFDDESSACFALLGRLVWSRLLRGALVCRQGRGPARDGGSG